MIAESAHDDVMQVLTDESRKLGAVPNVQAVAEFVAPIIRKIEVDGEDEARKAYFSPAVLMPEEATAEVILDRVTGEVREIRMFGEAPIPTRQEAERERVRFLLAMPAWGDRLRSVSHNPQTNRYQKANTYEEILASSVAAFGPYWRG